MLHANPRIETSEQLPLLVDELLGALDDTARLAADLALDWRWQVHLGYLRDLQRLGREALASAAGDRQRQLRSNVPRRGPRRCA
jgi:hypothetical protein